MKRKIFFAFVVCLISIPSHAMAHSIDREAQEKVFKARAADWRNGAVVYQVFPDRFAASVDPSRKAEQYKEPRKLHSWNELPAKGRLNEEAGLWSHELDFWGGDLKGIESRLDYVKGLGADVVYLNPIFKALSNHKYDTQDYMTVDPAFGTNDDLRSLVGAVHAKGMKIVLDGVFNHMGRTSEMFQNAQRDPHSRYRNYFIFCDSCDYGYIGWANVANLPELNLENREVKDFLFVKRDSVMQSYLRDYDIDGWRLDVAYEFGFDILSEMTKSAHEAKRGSEVIAEAWSYPAVWVDVADATMNLHARKLIFGLVEGEIPPAQCAAFWKRMIDDAGIEGMLKSWLILDNHDRPRLPNLLKEDWQREMALALQFTLPGSPSVYYGSELGMTGGDDPENRAPMRWDLASDGNATLARFKRMIALHNSEPALKYGDFIMLDGVNIFAFMRTTDKVGDTFLVIANPGSGKVRETLQLPDPRIHNWSMFKGQFNEGDLLVRAATVAVEIPPHSIKMYKLSLPDTPNSYNSYKRMR